MESLDIGFDPGPRLEPAAANFGYLEVLNRSGRTAQRFPITAAGLTLGRGFGNDLILDDPFVCPQHARIIWNGEGLEVHDLGSVNGLSIGSVRLRQEGCHLPSGTSFRIGRTVLRYLACDAPLLPTKLDRDASGPQRWLGKAGVLGLVYLLTGSALALQLYFDSAEKFQSSMLATSLVMALSFGLVWTSLWSFVNRTLSHRWNFGIHSGIACLGLFGALALNTLTGYACFSLGLDPWHLYLSYGLALILVWWLVFMHLRLTAAGSSVSLIRTSAIVGVLLVGAAVLVNQSLEEDFSQTPEFQASLKAPGFKVRGSLTPTAFFEDAGQLRDRLKP